MLVEAFSGGEGNCVPQTGRMEMCPQLSRASGNRIHGWLLILASPIYGLKTFKGSCNLPDRLRQTADVRNCL